MGQKLNGTEMLYAVYTGHRIWGPFYDKEEIPGFLFRYRFSEKSEIVELGTDFKWLKIEHFLSDPYDEENLELRQRDFFSNEFKP